MDIHQLYEAILRSLNLVPDQDGMISVRNDENDLRPVMIDDLRLTLPRPEILRSGNWGNRIAFHPLSENVLRGVSPVIEKLTTAVRVRLNYAISGLLYELVAAGADRSRHPSINPKAAAFLSAIPEVDEKSIDAMGKILQAVDTDPSRRLISIYLKRGGTYNGERVSRLAKVSFPILKEFDNGDSTIFGVKLRKKDQLAFRELFKYILPDADVTETYSGVGNSLVAPYFQAVMDAYLKVATQLNRVIHLQRAQLEDEEFLRMDLSWEEDFLNFEKYQGMIPPLPGNEGALMSDEPTFKGGSGNVNFNSAKQTVTGRSLFREEPQTTTTSKVEVKTDTAKPEVVGGINRDFSLQIREKEQQEAKARQSSWDNWKTPSDPHQPPFDLTPQPTAAPANVNRDRPARALDFNEIMAKRGQSTHAPFPGGVQPAFTMGQPVAPGAYAGHHRGVAVNQFGYGNPNTGYGTTMATPVTPHFRGGFGGFGAI